MVIIGIDTLWCEYRYWTVLALDKIFLYQGNEAIIVIGVEFVKWTLRISMNQI